MINESIEAHLRQVQDEPSLSAAGAGER